MFLGTDSQGCSVQAHFSSKAGPLGGPGRRLLWGLSMRLRPPETRALTTCRPPPGAPVPPWLGHVLRAGEAAAAQRPRRSALGKGLRQGGQDGGDLIQNQIPQIPQLQASFPGLQGTRSCSCSERGAHPSSPTGSPGWQRESEVVGQSSPVLWPLADPSPYSLRCQLVNVGVSMGWGSDKIVWCPGPPSAETGEPSRGTAGSHGDPKCSHSFILVPIHFKKTLTKDLICHR